MLMQTHEARLAALREELKRRRVNGFIIPISDEHMSEYVGDYAQRLHWLTGFGGSAGFAAVTMNHSAIFVDGRYTVQVRDQVDGQLFDYKSVPADSLGAWLAEVCEGSTRIAYDPWLHTSGLGRGAGRQGGSRAASPLPLPRKQLIDAVWADRPAPARRSAGS